MGGSLRPCLVAKEQTNARQVFANRTKTGCQTCRRRKKKCDEAKPECKRNPPSFFSVPPLDLSIYGYFEAVTVVLDTVVRENKFHAYSFLQARTVYEAVSSVRATRRNIPGRRA